MVLITRHRLRHDVFGISRSAMSRFLIPATVVVLLWISTTERWDIQTYSTMSDLSAIDTLETTSSSSKQQQTQSRRLPKEALTEIMSPPGIDPSNVPRVKASMVKCDVEKWAGYLRREHYYIYDGLIQVYGWNQVSLEDVRQMANGDYPLEQMPEVLFLCEPAILHLPHLLPWLQQLKEKRQHNIHIAYHTDDLTSLMNKVDTDLLGQAFQVFDTYMGTYAYRIEQYLRNVPILKSEMPNIVWIPHSVSPEFFLDYENDIPSIIPTTSNTTLPAAIKSINNNAQRQVVVAGKINHQYPLRMWAQEAMDVGKLPMMRVLKHGGYAWNHPQGQQVQFAQQLSTYQAAFTCSLFFHYIVAKLLEIPAVGTLLLVNHDVVDLLQALGLHESVHYKSYNSTNPTPTLEWAVDPRNQQHIQQMRHAGRSLVWQQHQVGHRVYAIASYFGSGGRLVTYPIPKQYKNDPCPVVTKLDPTQCRNEFLQKATKPLLALT